MRASRINASRHDTGTPQIAFEILGIRILRLKAVRFRLVSQGASPTKSAVVRSSGLPGGYELPRSSAMAIYHCFTTARKGRRYL